MARIDFDALHSVEPLGDRLLIRAVKGKALFEFTLDGLAVALLIPMLQRAATHLPATQQQEMLISMGFQPILSPQGEPGIEIALSDQLVIPLLLGQSGLDGLRACIDQLSPGTASAPGGPQAKH